MPILLDSQRYVELHIIGIFNSTIKIGAKHLIVYALYVPRDGKYKAFSVIMLK